MNKICSKCGADKSEADFSPSEYKRNPSCCKSCKKLYNNQYYQTNINRIKKQTSQYRLENKKEIKIRKQADYIENRGEKLASSKKYYDANAGAISKQKQIYRQLNKDSVRESHREYERKQLKSNPSFRLRKNVAKSVRNAIQRIGSLKNGGSILNHLPYSMDELKLHLENLFDDKMSWYNYGSYWHIDHIYPQSLLPYTSMEDDNFKKCWALNNLQPLEAIANIKKSNKII